MKTFRNLKLRQEQNVYWAFEPSYEYKSGNKAIPRWIILDNLEGSGRVAYFNATIYDLDDAIALYKRDEIIKHGE